MSEIEDKNRNIRISQQRNRFIKNILICVAVIVLISVIFIVVARNARGTEINLNEFDAQYENISEVYLNQNRIQIVYKNGEPHWLYNRNSVESYIVNKAQESLENNQYTPTIKPGTTTTISILSIIYPVLLIGVMIVIAVLIIKQVRGSSSKTFEFVKNRARVYPSKVKFSDVAGEDEEKEELQDIVDFLKNPQKYIELGAKIPKGVILVGPPGTGKTLLARAVAGEANVPFFTISGSDFMELFVGVGASRVRDLFETAKKAKPCIIFIDEIDAVGRQRGAGLGGGNDEREQTLNQLLVQMDGFEENEGIIVMAATNRVDILDPALLRPGRFDRRVNISMPDIKAREEILRVHARNKPLAKEVNLKTIARIISGFTGAEIENLLNEAAILAAKDNRKEITEKDIQKSIMKVTLGPQKKSRVVEEKDKYDTAIHESGHAIVSLLSKETSPVHEVSIIPRGGAGGYTVSTEDDHTVYFKEKLKSKIQMLLGGITAEKLFIGDISTGASSDLRRATELARRMVSEWGMSDRVGMVYCGTDETIFVGKNYQERVPYSESQATKIDEEIKLFIDNAAKETERIIKENKDKLLTMADILMEVETIYGEETQMILNGASKQEVVDFINGKQNKKNREKTQEKIAKNSKKSVKNVDELLKEAEKREKTLKKKAEKDREKAGKETKTKTAKKAVKKTSKKETEDGNK